MFIIFQANKCSYSGIKLLNENLINKQCIKNNINVIIYGF